MKVKVFLRNLVDYIWESRLDIYKFYCNFDLLLYFFEVLREYMRVLNVVKFECVFVKLFVSLLDGYMDGVYCIVRYFRSLFVLLFGLCDGEVSVC